MAQLRDLIVNGASRLIGDAYTNKIQVNSISAYTSSAKSAYGLGGSGQVLKSDGTNIYWANDNNSGGTVTSIKIATSAPLSGGTSSAVTTSGTWTLSLANAYGDTKNPYGNKNPNTVLAGPSTGSAAAPSFRALVAADIPNLAWSKITSGNDDLKAIENLTGTSGLLKKTGANTWSLDTTTYLPLSGGQMTGPLTWKNSTALPEATSIDYFLSTDSFSDGGKTHWVSNANVKKSLIGSSAIGSTKIPVYWDGDSFEQANGIFESLSYDYTTNSSKNTLKIKVNNNEKTCEILMKGLTIGDKTYYGNQAVEIGIADLGLTKAMTFRGVTETVLTDEATTSPVSIIGSSNLTPTDGDVVLYKPNSQEFVWSSGKWHLLGLASSFALQNHVHGNISNDGKLKINNAIAANKSVVTNSTGDITAKEQHFIFKGTCATAAGTAVKVVACPDFTSTDLIKGAAIAVVFSATNSAAVANLKLNVNSTGEKPIKYMYNNAVNNIPAVGYLLANQTYLFHYDGTNWVIDNMHYDTNANTLLRTYASTSTNELPLVGVSTNTSMAVPTHTSSYKDLYGGIPGTAANRATINLSTGHVKIPGGVESSQATLNKVIVQTTNAYGNTLPSTGSEGQLFFQTSDPYYELPAGGAAGQVLIKSSNNDRDVTWSSTGLGDYVEKSGDTMTGNLIVNNQTDESTIKVVNEAGQLYLYSRTSGTGRRGIYGLNASGTEQSMFAWNQDGSIHAGGQLYGAVWNDYAEYRKDNKEEKDIQRPGRCVKENGNGTLSLTAKRLERGCEIVSDTFGFAIGQDEENGYNTPIASSGRVLAYPYESIEEFSSHIGWPVCSGPNGTVSIMTDEEEEKYSSRIIGTISEIPDYEEWGSGKVKVNGRIWIRIR